MKKHVKVKIIRSDDAANFEKWINDFIKDKKVIDIQYTSYTAQKSNTMATCIDTAMIIYK